MLVAGASGDVGAGIVRAAMTSGWTVVGGGRSEAKLAQLAASLPPGTFHQVIGDLSDDSGARAMWEAASVQAGPIEATVVTVNAPTRPAPLLDWTAGDLSQLLHANLLTHFVAARTWLPHLPASGTFLGIGGGTADRILPQLGHLSMAQAALRMLYRGLAKEQADGARICELLLISMINGASKRQHSRPEWLTDDEVGRHVCAILEQPGLFPGPVLYLKSREGVGTPDPADSGRAMA